jgi:phosphoglycerate kinase
LLLETSEVSNLALSRELLLQHNKEAGMKKTIKDIDVRGKRVLMRADFNVPLENGEVADDTRIRAVLPTLRYLLERDARVILFSHLGRPKGKVVEDLRLNPVAARLAELLEVDVIKVDDTVGPEVEAAVEDLESDEVLLLENTRFYSEEKGNDPDFSTRLARLGDVYVNDAFGAAHRAHASTEGVARAVREQGGQAVAGLLMESELEALRRVVENPQHPYVAILGGAKVSDKIDVIKKLLDQVDTLLIGGGMANTFLKAKDVEIGQSLVEEESVDTAREILEQAREKLVLPVDVVIADAFDAQARRQTVFVEHVGEDWRIMDVGPRTIERFQEILQDAEMVVWNGPLGVFEMDPFSVGTFEIARTLADLDAVTVVGGGDSAAAVNEAGVEDEITHVSTGGGAFLNYLEGKELPGVAALDDK